MQEESISLGWTGWIDLWVMRLSWFAPRKRMLQTPPTVTLLQMDQEREATARTPDSRERTMNFMQQDPDSIRNTENKM